MPQIKVLFFASAREAAGGAGRIDLNIPDDCDPDQVRKILAEKYPGLSTMVMDQDSITLALNEEYVSADQKLPLKDGDTLALIPPISGG